MVYGRSVPCSLSKWWVFLIGSEVFQKNGKYHDRVREMTITLADYLIRWLVENMTMRAYTPTGLTKLAIDKHMLDSESWARVRIMLQRMVAGKEPDTRIENIGAWWGHTWKILLREKIVKNLAPGEGEHWKFTFVVVRIEDAVIYSVALLVNLIKEIDVNLFNSRHGLSLGLNDLRNYAAIALSAFHSNHITVAPAAKATGGENEMDGWRGDIWLSAYGLLIKNNLHLPRNDHNGGRSVGN